MLGAMTTSLRGRPCCGFTLIELLMAVVIVAILVSIGVPSMRNWLINQRVINTTAEMVTDLNLARSEAIQKGQTIEVSFHATAAMTCYSLHTTDRTRGNCSCLNGVGRACTDALGNPWNNGLVELKTVQIDLGSGVALRSATNIKYRSPTGVPGDPTPLQIDIVGSSGGQLRVTTNGTGRPSICSPGGAISGFTPCG